ncbi:DUF3306 domain-containing protein [Roseovarius sp. LXJ103]|uniref:DUF3306 domain-containing protein n=1 Tax=Roseovarius carneus TaxID=2853164 RepID=UPI0015E800F5|nr:DUF3306 domain-containing protein [Roseovarius carneus]MBZ8119429.1 DUF3306 domain-containing protein [Roseovarius carneus]
MSAPDESDGGFLSAWSRRKLAARQTEAEQAEITPEEPLEEETLSEAGAAEGEEPDADLIASLPSLDEITVGSDITPFMARGVPAQMKNAALRKLWSASPLVRDYADPAVDYAWDWNAPGGVPGGGGVLSEQSVAKMVKDLIGGPQEDTVAETPVEDQTAEDAPERAGDDPVDAAPDAPADTPAPVAVRRSDPGQTPASSPDLPGAERKATAAPQDHAALAPPRRHGGAMPE